MSSCWKTKMTKDNVCSQGATANEGTREATLDMISK